MFEFLEIQSVDLGVAELGLFAATEDELFELVDEYCSEHQFVYRLNLAGMRLTLTDVYGRNFEYVVLEDCNE